MMIHIIIPLIMVRATMTRGRLVGLVLVPALIIITMRWEPVFPPLLLIIIMIWAILTPIAISLIRILTRISSVDTIIISMIMAMAAVMACGICLTRMKAHTIQGRPSPCMGSLTRPIATVVIIS